MNQDLKKTIGAVTDLVTSSMETAEDKRIVLRRFDSRTLSGSSTVVSTALDSNRANWFARLSTSVPAQAIPKRTRWVRNSTVYRRESPAVEETVAASSLGWTG